MHKQRRQDVGLICVTRARRKLVTICLMFVPRIHLRPKGSVTNPKELSNILPDPPPAPARFLPLYLIYRCLVKPKRTNVRDQALNEAQVGVGRTYETSSRGVHACPNTGPKRRTSENAEEKRASRDLLSKPRTRDADVYFTRADISYARRTVRRLRSRGGGGEES